MKLLKKWSIAAGKLIINLTHSFFNNEFPPEDFSNGFINQWNFERGDGVLNINDPKMSAALPTKFLADTFNGDDHREIYELSE
ncbi:colicin immunity domain-containing protein [Variovorax sp. H27-G14]|uniref:hypothetical protein n=1 Tax=Variovorax sp. H27-G14 TaxID=3111914 RepID=UPI0038FC21DA